MPDPDRSSFPLKVGTHRSLTVEDGRVLKRWHHPSPWSRWLDPWRSRREAQRLRALAARGVRAPRVLGVDGATLELEWITSARTLDQALPEANLELARGLGRWLQQLAQAGVQHGDLHGRNVLLDAAQEPWLIDMADVRLGGPLSAAQAQQQLILLLSETIEGATPAWTQCLAQAAGVGTTPVAALLAQARETRRASVERELDRWLRPSSRCSVQGALLEARLDLSPPLVRVRYERETAQELQRLWLAAARLVEHGLDVARPWRWERGATPWVELALPAAAQPADPRDVLRQWEPALRERGLRIPLHSELKAAQEPDGRSWLIGVRRLENREGQAPWP